MRTTDDLENLEIDLLLEGVYQRCGYDFREYARGSLRRRVRRRVEAERVQTVLLSRVEDQGHPHAADLPLPSGVDAGCSTGEETFSLAMLLQEEGLYERTRIYATDINQEVLDRAESGVFPMKKMRDFTQNYIKSGGRKAFSEYYVSGPGGARFRKDLLENVVFAQHNLVSDRSFNQFNLIMCRNVMIYFDKGLQNHVLELFHKSLVHFGILTLGRQESIRFTSHEECYAELDTGERICRRPSMCRSRLPSIGCLRLPTVSRGRSRNAVRCRSRMRSTSNRSIQATSIWRRRTITCWSNLELRLVH